MTVLETLERNLVESMSKLAQCELKWQADAWSRFQEIGLVAAEDSLNLFRLKELYSGAYQTPNIETKVDSLASSALVFVNGIYREDLSQVVSGLTILPLKRATKTYGSFLQGRSAKEKNPFVLLNQATFQEGLFLYVPPRTVLDQPLQIVHYFEGEEQLVCTPRLHVLIGKEASVDVEVRYVQNGQIRHWINELLDVVLEPNARSKWTFDEKSSSFHMQTLRSSLKRDSHLSMVTAAGEAPFFRLDAAVELLEESAEVSLCGVLQLDEKREGHVKIFIDHQAPHTRSTQRFKSVLDGLSKHAFEGKIYVHPVALKTEAYQLNNNLLLSERAQCTSRPNLEIFADDVKASHGATIGQLDQEQLFYLKTRGIPHRAAEKILLKGFVQEILNMMPS